MINKGKKIEFFMNDSLYEVRSVGDDTYELSGYAVKWNSPTQINKNMSESFEPGAFTESLNKYDVVALNNHDRTSVLGRFSNGTLDLLEDEIGLKFTIIINKEDTDAMNLYNRVKRGDIKGCSFGFIPQEEELNTLTSHHHITKALLIEISITAFPAYKDTIVNARNEEEAVQDELFKRASDAINKIRTRKSQEVIIDEQT